MKKLLLSLLLFTTVLTAQNRPDWDYDLQRPISIDFPVKLTAIDEYLVTQNTYYEYNWVSNNLRILIEQRLKMNFQDAENVWKDTYMVDVYKTRAGQTIEKINIKYNTFELYGLPVVESIEITGSFTAVSKLFIFLYNTEFQSGDLPSDQFVKNYRQDNALYSLKDGKASIKITNSALNRSLFVELFNAEKEKFKKGLN